MQSPKDLAVSEWAAILGFLFQIEQPPEGEPEASVNWEPQTQHSSAASPDAAFWAGLMVHRPAVPLNKVDDIAELGKAEPVAIISPSDDEELQNEALQLGEGFELSGSDWLMLPAPLLVEHRHSTRLLGDSVPASSNQREPTGSAQSQQPQNPEHATLAEVSSEPTTVEAVFRLQPTMPNPPKVNSPDPSLRELPSGASGLGSLIGVHMELQEERVDRGSNPTPSKEHPPSSEADEGTRHSTARDNSGDPQAGNQENTPPRELPTLTERGTLSISNRSDYIGIWSDDKLRVDSTKPVHESIQNSTNILLPAKRASSLQFQLRISPNDFGTPSTGGGNEIRLNLLQRGDDVLMKIQGGGEPLALSAKAEWEALVERLKPHGLEPSSKAFHTETNRREGEPWIPSVPEQAKSDSAAVSEQEHRRSGQEQQQQQRQQKQRYSTRSGANSNPFSLDYGPADPQAIQGATS